MKIFHITSDLYWSISNLVFGTSQDSLASEPMASVKLEAGEDASTKKQHLIRKLADMS